MSLAAQLKKLQIPGQAVIQQVSSKNASLLFDARTAASLDNEAIQNIGYHGFQELLSVDPVFSQFENLFNADSLKFQRNLESEDVSKKIKKKIRNYLVLLSPYLLLKPAHKTLEWLVRRYQCHIWDKDSLIACILPFHESNIFARIIQMFGTDTNNDSWDWLVPCQKEGVGFSTQALVNNLVGNRNLLSFVCKMAENAKGALKFGPKSGLKIIFSFHARMLVSVLEATSFVKEETLSFLLPHLYSGLKSNVKDYVCSTYMVITALSSKTKLMKDVCKAILASILKSMEPSWYEEGLLCFLSVLQLQKVNALSQRILRLFLNLQPNSVIDLLIKLRHEHDTSVLIELMVPLLCKCAYGNDSLQEKAVGILKAFIDNLRLSKKEINLLCRKIIEESIESDSEDVSREKLSNEEIKGLLVLLSNRHAAIFDDCIGFYFRHLTESEDEVKFKRLKEVMGNCLSSEKHKIYEGSDFPLMLSLNHPEPSIRIVAVDHLLSSWKSRTDDDSRDYFVDAVMARLSDDDDNVVKTVLKYPKSLIQLLPANTLYDLAMNLMEKSGHYNINDLIVGVIQSLSSDDNSARVNKFVYALLGQIMYAFIGKRNKKLVEALDCIEFNSKNVILKGISKALFHINTRSLSKEDCSGEMVVSAFVSLIDHVADTIIASENSMAVVSDLSKYIQELPAKHDLQFIRLMLLLALVGKLPTLSLEIMELNFSKYLEVYELFSKSGESLLDVTDTSEIGEKKKYLFSEYYSSLKPGLDGPSMNLLLSQAFFVFLKVIVRSFANNQKSMTESLIARQKLFSIVSSCALNTTVPCYRNLLNEVLAGLFSDKGELLSFLCGLYIKLIESDRVDEECFKSAVCSLHITKSLLPGCDQSVFENCDHIIYATHIALLASPFTIIRKVVLENIVVLSEIAACDKVWGYMLRQANGSTNELSIDPSYARKCWQLSFDIKEEGTFGQFIKKSKEGKKNMQRITSLNGLTKSLKSYPVALQISLLDSLQLVDSKYVIGDYISMLKNVLLKPVLSAEEINLILLVMRCIKSEMMESVEELFPFLVKCMNHKESAIQDFALKLITPSFYNSTSPALKYSLLKELLKILQSSSSVTVSTSVRVIIKAVELRTDHLTSLLQEFSDSFEQAYASLVSNTDGILYEVSDNDLKLPFWRTLIEILEAISYKKEAPNRGQLVPKLFRILETCLKCSGVEYVKQLILSTLLCIMKQDLSGLSEDQFPVGVLVQCLQSSCDMQTSHHCLGVLSGAAYLYPTLVLHNIMHIFSFMAGNILRLDNEYSFGIMEKTINAVVPVLIQKDENWQGRKRPSPSSVDEIVVYILQTFVDSIPHCPEHRRLHIIKHLVDILKENEYLHRVIILLLRKVTLHRHKHRSEEKNMELSPISLEFCKDLFFTYSIPTQVHSLYQMIAYLNSQGEKEAKSRKGSEETSGELEFNNRNKGANLDQYIVLTFALEVLRNKDILLGYDGKLCEQQQLTHLYLQLVEELLSYGDVLGKSDEEARRVDTSIQKKVSDVISQLYELLPLDSFITIISKLLYKEIELIRRKSLDLLCKKLGTIENLTDTEKYTLLELFKILIDLVKYKEENDECATNKQMMLYAIKLIAMKLCSKQKEHFIKAVPVIAQLYSIEDSNKMVSTNAMLCVAELSSLLKTEMIPYIPIVMKPLLEKTSVKDTKEECQKDKLLFVTTSVTILHALLKSISQFCSPYVSDFILNVSSYDIIADELLDAPLMKKVAALKADIGKFFPPRVLYPAIETCFEELLQTDKQRTVSVVDIYRYSFQTISKSDANSNYSKDISNITKTILSVHSILGCDDVLCDTLENLVIQAFSGLILKLTENTLRPMYLDLFSWATETSEMSRRLLSFYRLSLELSKSLKSLFLLFVGHILKNSSDVLSKVNTANEDFDIKALGKQKILEELVIAVLDTLSNCFLYDSQGYINKERFESIMYPLLNQMENKLSDSEYMSFAKDHLSPCIVNFVSLVNDTSCWKQLNHEILSRTKSECEKVRFMSLYITEKVCTHMGEAYMVLIPETIPFLAEILEDESLEVEKQCQKVIQVIEEISGESIQKYF